MNLDYLCVGHVCHDLVNEDIILGGTASYASLVASRLGKRTGLISSYGSDFAFVDRFKSRNIHCIHQESEDTTVFENIYRDNGRIQYMHRRAATIPYGLIPEEWRHTPVIHLCLIADELEDNFIQEMALHRSDSQVIGMAIQGVLRDVTRDKKVIPKPIKAHKYRGVTVALMSDDDIAHDPSIATSLAEFVPIVIVTHGADGATAYARNSQKFYPAYRTTELDPTGAGDVFGTAFLFAYQAHKSLEKAMIYAHAAASISVEGRGTSSIPTIQAIEERVRLYHTQQ